MQLYHRSMRKDMPGHMKHACPGGTERAACAATETIAPKTPLVVPSSSAPDLILLTKRRRMAGGNIRDIR
jgi:hypothetical protein